MQKYLDFKTFGTFNRHLLHALRTVLRRLEAPPGGDQLHYFLVSAAWVRHIAQREHLPQQDAERPKNAK